MEDISVIIPYHNESKTIETTLTLLVNQTRLPKEVILVNSTSTDDSYNVVQNWIENNARKYGVTVLNIDEGTNVPGSSMNVGIKHSTGDVLAFMDCGLLFDSYWLKYQLEYMKINKSEVVSGLCCFEGMTLLDKSAIAQTYGYQRVRPTVPSSLVKKTVFEKTGLFLENRRAGHDVDWINKLAREKIRRDINERVRIRYNGVNYAKSFKDIFLKTIRYSENTVGLYKYYNHHVYGLFLLSLVILYFVKIRFFRPWSYNEYIPLAHIDKLWQYINVQTALAFLMLYVIIRGYAVPSLKSRNCHLFYEHPLSILTLPAVGFIMDIGKLVGYTKGIILAIWFYIYHKMGRCLA